jgi:hypothetical protein
MSKKQTKLPTSTDSTITNNMNSSAPVRMRLTDTAGHALHHVSPTPILFVFDQAQESAHDPHLKEVKIENEPAPSAPAQAVAPVAQGPQFLVCGNAV